MVVMRTHEGDPDTLAAQYILESLKRGRNGYPNLRKKYHRPEHRVSDETLADWEAKKLDSDELDHITIQLTQQNVFHASDGPHDGIGTLLRLRENMGECDRSFFKGDLNRNISRVVGRLDEILMRHAEERDMSKITREWRVIDELPREDSDFPIRQVYVWLLTNDSHVVIVSKDGEKWQLPGGKSDAGEGAVETAIREVFEETNVDIQPYKDELRFFGEYMIEDRETDVHPPRYRQVRAWLNLPVTADQLNLSTAGEAAGQRLEDAVRFVKSVPTRDILSYIEWLEKTDEYKALKRKKVIDRANLSL